jgi:hypothetical protein
MSESAIEGRPTVAVPKSSYFSTFCIGLLIVNLCAFLYHFLGAQVFNAVGNAVSLAIIAYSIQIIMQSKREEGAAKGYLLVALVTTTLSVIYNLQVASITDALKYLSIYVFYAAGRATGGKMKPIELRCIVALGIVPILFLLTKGSSKVYENESFASEVFSYFPNANTGVLYFSALLFAVTQLYGNRVILFQFINAIVMNKLGAAVATAVASCLWIVMPIRSSSLVALIAVGIGGAVALSVGALDRGIATFDNLMLVFSMDPSAIASMSYKQLVTMTGSTDLSAFFRLIHWTDIWNVYSSQGTGVFLFGYGSGQTALVTYAALVAHNDYLRILVEYGLINLAIFAPFLIHVYRSLPVGATRVLFVVLCIYFFSENLLDNFTSMALYFAYAGRASVMHGSRSGAQVSVRKRARYISRETDEKEFV